MNQADRKEFDLIHNKIDQIKEDIAKWLMKSTNKAKYKKDSQDVIMNSTFKRESTNG